MTGNVGSLSPLRTTLQPDPAIVNELLWKQVFDGGRTVVQLGKIALSSHVATNRVANSGVTQFQAAAMEIPSRFSVASAVTCGPGSLSGDT